MNQDDLDIIAAVLDAANKGHITTKDAHSFVLNYQPAMSGQKIYTDDRGHQLNPGVRVAFNYSGQVAIGVIKELRSSKAYIKRETHLNHHFGSNNPYSLVRYENMIAINEVEHIEEVSRKMQQDARKEYVKGMTDFQEMLANAWDLDEVKMWAEEKFGKGWEHKFESE